MLAKMLMSVLISIGALTPYHPSPPLVNIAQAKQVTLAFAAAMAAEIRIMCKYRGDSEIQGVCVEYLPMLAYLSIILPPSLTLSNFA